MAHPALYLGSEIYPWGWTISPPPHPPPRPRAARHRQRTPPPLAPEESVPCAFAPVGLAKMSQMTQNFTSQLTPVDLS